MSRFRSSSASTSFNFFPRRSFLNPDHRPLSNHVLVFQRITKKPPSAELSPSPSALPTWGGPSSAVSKQDFSTDLTGSGNNNTAVRDADLIPKAVASLKRRPEFGPGARR